MCLSIPGKIVKIEKDRFVVDYETEKRVAEMALVDVCLGDYVIISNKIIVAKISKKEAENFLEIANEG